MNRPTSAWLAVALIACGSSGEESPQDGAGGALSAGTGGADASGGANEGGSNPQGGASGAVTSTGGAPTGGTFTGGAPTGGSPPGGFDGEGAGNGGTAAGGTGGSAAASGSSSGGTAGTRCGEGFCESDEYCRAPCSGTGGLPPDAQPICWPLPANCLDDATCDCICGSTAIFCTPGSPEIQCGCA